MHDAGRLTLRRDPGWVCACGFTALPSETRAPTIASYVAAGPSFGSQASDGRQAQTHTHDEYYPGLWGGCMEMALVSLGAVKRH